MKRILACAVLTLAAGQALGGPSSYEEARVLESIPVYRTHEVSIPRQECWQEEVVRHDSRRGGNSHTPGILGAVVGGALGNAVGHNKSNKRVGAVVGAILGGSIGSDIGRRHAREPTVYHDLVEHCRTVHDYREEQKLVGYDVLYRYNGREYSIRLPQDPGPTLRLRVNIEPVL